MDDLGEIDDDELLYRKVSVNSGWYDPKKKELKPDALKPKSADVAGISFDRAQSDAHPDFRTAKEAAVGPSTGGYFIAVFRVGDLSSCGLSITADPIEDNPGHALLTQLTYQNRKDDSSREVMVRLAHELVVRIEGPFRLWVIS